MYKQNDYDTSSSSSSSSSNNTSSDERSKVYNDLVKDSKKTFFLAKSRVNCEGCEMKCSKCHLCRSCGCKKCNDVSTSSVVSELYDNEDLYKMKKRHCHGCSSNCKSCDKCRSCGCNKCKRHTKSEVLDVLGSSSDDCSDNSDLKYNLVKLFKKPRYNGMPEYEYKPTKPSCGCSVKGCVKCPYNGNPAPVPSSTSSSSTSTSTSTSTPMVPVPETDQDIQKHLDKLLQNKNQDKESFDIMNIVRNNILEKEKNIKKFNVSVGDKQGHKYSKLIDGKKSFYINGKNGPMVHLYRNNSYVFSLDPEILKNENYKFTFIENPMKVSGKPNMKINNVTESKDGSYLTLDVTKDTPRYFYYQCLNHNLIGGIVVVHDS
jgi:hypothetical protein